MELESLLLSRDPEVLRVLRPALDKLDISVEVCTGSEAASEILASKKFDAVIIDCDDVYGGTDVLREVRKGSSNKSSVTFAILNGITTMQAVFGMGAMFVLQKPITLAGALRSFNAAYGLMHRERRRYFRLPVEIPVTMLLESGGNIKVTAFDLSEGGMAILAPKPLPDSAISQIQFTLPDTAHLFQLKVQVAWKDGAGRGGVRFLELPQASREQLELWILKKLEQRQRAHLTGSSDPRAPIRR
jgi:ActR/RegA family two-component response regulator